MKWILIIDTETTGTDPAKNAVIEIAAVLFDIDSLTYVEAFSSLLPAVSNAAEKINGIPEAALRGDLATAEETHGRLEKMAQVADVAMAHNAEFDRAFIQVAIGGPLLMRDPHTGPELPWACSCEDVEWPAQHKPGMSLVALALAHGLGVAGAHRAMDDALLLAKLLTRAAEMGMDIREQVRRALRPKDRVISLAPFNDRELVKSHGFRWDPEHKTWWRRMPAEDALKLPFKTRLGEGTR